MNTLRMLTVLVLFMIALLVPNVTSAANHYIHQAATGANNGSDWTNAWTDLPTTFTRGDTYYVADGTYTGHTFSTAVSGTTMIYVKKATVSDHGTNTGWSDTYGDGYALFNGTFEFTSGTGYWEINGQKRDSWTSGYGFRVHFTGGHGIWASAQNIHTLTLKYIDVYSDSMDSSSGCQFGIDVKYGYHNSIYIGYNYIHTLRGANIGTGGWNVGSETDGIIEYNYIAQNGSDAVCHGDTIAANADQNMIIRYNMMGDEEGTGFIVALTRGASVEQICNNWEIYGNVFFQSYGNPYGRSDIDFGIVTAINSQSAKNWYIYNNTTVNIVNNASGVYMYDDAFPQCPHCQNHENIFVFNNLWYDSTAAGLIHTGNCTNCVATHNYYMGRLSTHSPDDSNEETYASLGSSIFVNYFNNDFALARATNDGYTTGLNNMDLLFNTRGVDGVWDRGAYEFSDGSYNAAPAPPTNLVIVGQQ